MTGRPSSFTQQIADEICARLVDGESLRSICLTEGMPHISTVCRWLGSNEAFREQYARAREAQADTLFDEILDIADNASNDWMERKGEDGSAGWVLNGEHVQRSKLRIEARKWMAGKLRPKKYGERIAQEISGPDGGPVQVDDTQAASRIASLLARAEARRKAGGDSGEDLV